MMRFLVVASLLLIVGTPNRAADWPQFRGPTGQGIVEKGSLPLRWSEEQNVPWKVPIPGLGWSSPVVVGNKVYLTTAVPSGEARKPDYSLRCLCLSADTGKVLWNVEVFQEKGATAPRIHRKNSHASPTPIYSKGEGDAQDKLYVHFGHQGTACLNPANGAVVWQNQVRYRPVHGNGGTPVLVTSGSSLLLIFSCDGARQRFVLALDARTGKQRWKTNRDVEVFKKFSFCTPLVLTVNGRKQVVSPGSNMVGGYDVKTGKEIWRVTYRGYSVVPRPVYGQGLVFMSTGYDSPRVLAIRPDGTGDVTDTHVAWTQRRGAPHTPSMLVVGKELYMISDRGIASCVDAATGKKHWQQRLPGAYSASPTYAAGRIYFTSEDGVTTVVAAAREYKQLARNTVKGRTFASFAAADGVLYLRSESQLYRIEKKGE